MDKVGVERCNHNEWFWNAQWTRRDHFCYRLHLCVASQNVEKSSVRLLEIEFGFLNRRNFREKNFEKLPYKVTREDKELFTDDSERTERKGKRKSKSIVYSVGVLIGIAQNVLI